MADLFLDTVLLPGGWARDVRMSIDAGGWITAVESEAKPRGASHVPGIVVPGVPDAHSHASQRALAGLTERGSPDGDSFWSWRERMYAFLERLDPDVVEAIATRLYAELLRHGFTSVVEFHYLRNDPSGHPYADPVEMAQRILAAAERTGMGVTILPTVYRASDFGGEPPLPAQRRFTASVEDLIGDVAVLGAGASPATVRVGLALHSLRAVPPGDLAVAVEAVRGMDPEIPIHIHVAEQAREVRACEAWSGARPVRWLLDRAPVDEHWCLVHATHVDGAEIDGVAKSGAVVGLCPTTEANLGDGIFPFAEFARAGGRWAVGTDAHTGRSPVGELRTLEYAQRLSTGTRNVAAGPTARSTGRALLEGAWSGGARASGRRIGRLAVGYRADLIVLDGEHPDLVGREEDDVLDSWIFSGDESPVRHVVVGGTPVVRDGRHVEEEEIRGVWSGIAGALGSRSSQLDLDLER